MYDDQEYKEKQQEAYTEYCQSRWQDGYFDALSNKWNCCSIKTESCSHYCKYLAGYLWGQEQAGIHYRSECASNLAVLDSEYCDEF